MKSVKEEIKQDIFVESWHAIPQENVNALFISHLYDLIAEIWIELRDSHKKE